MERNIKITLEKAKEWYNSNNESLKEIALQAFSKDALTAPEYTRIRTFEDALAALKYNESTKVYIRNTINDISMYSKASAAMFKLNIIRKALNLGQDLSLTKNLQGYLYHPYNPFVTKSSTYYKRELNSGKIKVIGKIKSEGKIYKVLGGDCSAAGGMEGLGSFYPNIDVGFAYASFGFLGCASKEIAQHFGKYFGMLILEAEYGDLQDFQIISRY